MCLIRNRTPQFCFVSLLSIAEQLVSVSLVKIYGFQWDHLSRHVLFLLAQVVYQTGASRLPRLFLGLNCNNAERNAKTVGVIFVTPPNGTSTYPITSGKQPPRPPDRSGIAVGRSSLTSSRRKNVRVGRS